MEQLIRIRMAEPGDAKEILKVYAPYIRETAVTFEYTVPTEQEFAGRIRDILRDMPYVVCEIDGKTAGYAYASHYRSRAAYQWDCELSIYIDEDYHRGGVGRILYGLLFELLAEMNYVHAYACITTPNDASIGFHESLGFETCARFEQCGYKKGCWYDVTWMDRRLSAGPKVPPGEPGSVPGRVQSIRELPADFIANLFHKYENQLETALQNDIMICKNFLGLLDL